MKKRSREGPFDGEGMDYFQAVAISAAFPVIPVDTVVDQAMGLTLKSPVKVIVCAASEKFLPSLVVVRVNEQVSAFTSAA